VARRGHLSDGGLTGPFPDGGAPEGEHFLPTTSWRWPFRGRLRQLEAQSFRVGKGKIACFFSGEGDLLLFALNRARSRRVTAAGARMEVEWRPSSTSTSTSMEGVEPWSRGVFNLQWWESSIFNLQSSIGVLQSSIFNFSNLILVPSV